MSAPINFTDLNTWQTAHQIVIAIYKITDKFPARDAFGIASQMQRSALSVTSNIAEGFGRQQTNDKLHFYTMARGSLTELENQLLAAGDVGRINAAQCKVLTDKVITVHKLLYVLMRSTKKGAS